MTSGWPRLFVFLFLACVAGSLTYAIWPPADTGSRPPGSGPRAHPRLAYWFWTPEILEDEKYLAQARDLARRGAYTLAFASPRYPQTGVDFMDTDRFAPLFKKTADALAEHGMGLGLDLRFYLGVNRELPPGRQQGLVERVDVALDAQGNGTAALPANPVLFKEVARLTGARVLGVYDASEGLDRLSAVRASLDERSLRLACGPSRADRTVHALLLRTLNHPDMFSPAYAEAFESVLTGYRDVGLAGAALDEFAYLPLEQDRWRTTLYYSAASAERFRARHGADLERAMARILIGPPGPERTRAALRYLEHHRDAIAALEARFYATVKRILGRAAFVGVHPTNQTRPDYNDLERSLTFLDWWSVPRDFGQTDEYTPLAVRMGLALKAGGPVWYNMFYHPDPDAIFEEIARSARYGGRVHYHALNDAFYGYPLEKDAMLEKLAAIQQRLAVLDRSIGSVPELDTLVVLGWPAIMLGESTAYRQSMEFLNRLWERGYRCAAVPSYEIGAGGLTLREGEACYGGRRFRRVIVYRPEHARVATLAFLRAVAGSEHVELRVVGRLTRDAEGRAVPREHPVARFTVSAEALLETRGPGIDEPGTGVRYPGHRRVFVDRPSLETGRAARRTLEVGGRRYEFTFAGVLVLEMKPGEPPTVVARGQPD
jgi:hypothetical protein